MRARFATLARLLSLVIAIAALSAPAVSQGAGDMDDLLAVMERLKLKLPTNVYGSDPVRQFLGQLSRERCDQQAIADLGKALESAGYRREASTALVSYSETCGGHAQSLRSAVAILVRLSDYADCGDGRVEGHRARAVRRRRLSCSVLWPTNSAACCRRRSMTTQPPSSCMETNRRSRAPPISAWPAATKSWASSVTPYCRSRPGSRSIRRATIPVRRRR